MDRVCFWDPRWPEQINPKEESPAKNSAEEPSKDDIKGKPKGTTVAVPELIPDIVIEDSRSSERSAKSSETMMELGTMSEGSDRYPPCNAFFPSLLPPLFSFPSSLLYPFFQVTFTTFLQINAQHCKAAADIISRNVMEGRIHVPFVKES